MVDEPTRRYVPRRFTITPWQLADVAEPAPYVEPFARLLRVWLLPGTAYPLPRTATVIRGRVIQDGRPKRWARVQGTTPTSDAGWAHTDERGEFVLPIIDAGADLTRVTTDQITVTLRVIGTPTVADPPPPPTDRTRRPGQRGRRPLVQPGHAGRAGQRRAPGHRGAGRLQGERRRRSPRDHPGRHRNLSHPSRRLRPPAVTRGGPACPST